MAKDQRHVISATATIPASPSKVYGILANYRDEHRKILPPQFTEMVVEKGGIGTGTVIRFEMRLLGRKQAFRAVVTEPEPGRVLVESMVDPNSRMSTEPTGTVTTFTVDPEPGTTKSQVTIRTEMPVHGGILGSIERYVSTKLLAPIFERELELLVQKSYLRG